MNRTFVIEFLGRYWITHSVNHSDDHKLDLFTAILHPDVRIQQR